MLKQRLSQKLLQKLSPQQIQLMKLLMVPTASLDQRIKEELEANPALEEGGEEEETDAIDELDEVEKEENEEIGLDDDIDVTDYLSDDDVASYKLSNNDYSGDDDEQQGAPIKVHKTFHESLIAQLGLHVLDDQQLAIAMQIIGSIDEDGYMRRPVDALMDDLAFSQNIVIEADAITEMLDLVKGFDPPGVGAADLQECLVLQLARMDEEDELVQVASQIILDNFESFVKKHFEKMQKRLDISDEVLKDAMELIVSLNPKPGSAYSEDTKTEQYVIPDFLITNKDGELELTLNARNAPELKISRNFQEMLQGYAESKKKDKQQKEAILFIKQKIDGAKWFIDAIRQRQETMMNTMGSIMKYQYDYFQTGDETMLKPMILKDIAEMTDLDISTVSRVANSKYVQTEFGTFLLKSFFSESLETESGEEVSTREVKKILSDLIEDENKSKPLSDQKLTELLKEKGYNIARRTVAKYREQLNIPVARLRKEL
jgi:RNA polymerase sigma-54 factor